MTRPRCWTAPMPTRKSSWVAFTSSTFPISTRRSHGRPAVPRRCTVSSRCVHSWIGLPTSASSGQRRCNRRTEQTMRKLLVFNQVSLDNASWQNTTLVQGDIAAAVRNMKNERGPGMVILGSGSIVSQLTQAGLIDEYQMVVNPVVLGEGKTMFAGIKEKVTLQLIGTRAFGNGNVVLCYEPMA